MFGFKIVREEKYLSEQKTAHELKEINFNLVNRNSRLKADIQSLREQNSKLRAVNSKRREENSSLREEIRRLKKAIHSPHTSTSQKHNN